MAPVCVWQTLVPKKRKWAPHRGLEDHTYQHEECMCAPYACHGEGVGHCWMVADGYLRWTAWVSCRASFQMWGSWYLSRSLLWDGSLILMNKASLMVLVTPYTSCLQWKTVNIDAMSCRLTMLVNGEGP